MCIIILYISEDLKTFLYIENVKRVVSYYLTQAPVAQR